MYGKIFSEIYDSSISGYGGITMYVFMSMIVLSDGGGFVRFTTKTLADRIKLPLDSVLEAVTHLEAPDPESSNPEYEGRRIIPLKEATGGEECRGWWIISHKKWKEIARREDQRVKTRERVRCFREKKADVTQGNAVKRPVTKCTPSDTDTYSDADTDAYSDNLRNICIEKWNEFAKENNLSEIQGIKNNSTREIHLRMRLKEGIDFDLLLEKIKKQTFLLGENKEGWTVTFDWVINKANSQKIMEEQYLKREMKKPSNKQISEQTKKWLEKSDD